MSSPHALLVTLRGRTTRFELAPGRSLTIGRTAECEISLDDSLVSRRHATLHAGARLELEDLGSHNGTWVLSPPQVSAGETHTMPSHDRLRPGARVVLEADAVIQIGGALITIEPPVDATTQATAADVVVRDPAMRRIYELAARVARSELAVLLLGESGVGKEVLARFVHQHSPRADRELLGINCGALPEHLLEAELFGSERGAFTGAVKTTKGLLELADGGTVFFDEIGEMPLAVQVKLLRVVETNSFMRVGGREEIATDVRYLAATNRDLAVEVASGRFREDLYYRLSGFTLAISPLRERRSEIVPLAERFLAEENQRRTTVFALTPAAAGRLEAHAWPGNVRELRNVVRRAIVLCDGARIEPAHIELGTPVARTAEALHELPGASPESLRARAEDLEKARILAALEQCAGNQTRAAALLGITRRALVARLTKYDVARPRKRRT